MARSTDITSFTEHRRHLREHLQQVRETGRPMYITTNGETNAVVLSPEASLPEAVGALRMADDRGVINIKIDNVDPEKIDNVDPERQFTLEDYLAATENVSNVKVVTRHETAVVFDVKTKLLRQALERKLMRAKFDGFKLGFPQVVGRTIVFNAKDTKK